MRTLIPLSLAVFLTLTGAARASDRDSVTITITPNAAYSLTITTDTVYMDLGSVGLGLSTKTVRPSTVTITSSYNATDLKLQGAMVSGGWTFDAATGSQENDALASWAVFTDTGVATVPADGSFTGTAPTAAGSDVFDGTDRDVGDNGASSDRFVATGLAGYKTMEDIPSNLADAPAATSHLWFRFRLPNTTTTNSAKQIMVTLTAVAPN